MQIQELILRRFSGGYNSASQYISLMVEVILVLVFVLVLWRLVVAFTRKKQAKRKANSYFETSFSKEWRRNVKEKK